MDILSVLRFSGNRYSHAFTSIVYATLFNLVLFPVEVWGYAISCSLANEPTVQVRELSDGKGGFELLKESDGDGIGSGGISYSARWCSCRNLGARVGWEDYDLQGGFYCLVSQGDACLVPPRPSGPEQDLNFRCFKSSIARNILRNYFPVIMLWYMVLVIALLFTPLGRNAQRYLVRKYVCRRRNQIEAERFIARNTENLSGTRVLSDEAINNRLSSLPTRLELKTKLHFYGVKNSLPDYLLNATERKTDVHLDSDGPMVCSICLNDVKHGDKVGVLQCDHIFHSDCLKIWLRKKNLCPLCQRKDIAVAVSGNNE
uniref:RING-type E3 ubiquitin transferase n=1 Tax=Proboscia inermis TaxID=420281 RepID=A0A7S0C9A4_9STRA|mmetsp:Transcript_34489/g.34684  ORF Transcript_34489/g.34684 Transcript_34489/m.34684 type:complete len:315 (+) Transcript_34489:86-1030(+)